MPWPFSAARCIRSTEPRALPWASVARPVGAEQHRITVGPLGPPLIFSLRQRPSRNTIDPASDRFISPSSEGEPHVSTSPTFLAAGCRLAFGLRRGWARIHSRPGGGRSRPGPGTGSARVEAADPAHAPAEIASPGAAGARATATSSTARSVPNLPHRDGPHRSAASDGSVGGRDADGRSLSQSHERPAGGGGRQRAGRVPRSLRPDRILPCRGDRSWFEGKHFSLPSWFLSWC